ncbi:basic salivary proline-rich protein 1-like [Moschus berezovskii]|uniref:basic salivary proline-rich protein 1-like n=1 Tax=Moschus berezovskii TaxID=68408 RepID=UPI0024445C4E|nr:basic salivary proline-rich protein 1-like [Moschus berezovskii]
MPRPRKLSGEKDAGSPRRQWPRRTPTSSRPHNSSPDRGAPSPPAGRAPRGLPAARSPTTGGRGPLRARGAARERPVSHRPQHGVGRRRPRRRHLPAPRAARGPRGGSARKVSLPSSRPAGGPPDDQARFTYPAGRGRPQRRRSDFCSSRAPRAGSPCLPAPASQSAASGPAQPARSGRGGRAPQTPAGDPPAPPVEAHNGRGAGLSPARARASAPPPTRRARARARAHPSARSPPFLACSLAPPGQSRAPGPRGRGQRGGHTRLGGWGSGLAPLLGVEGARPDADWLHARRPLPGLPGAGEPSRRTVHLLAKYLTWKTGWAPFPSPRTGLCGEFRNFPRPGNESSGLSCPRRPASHLFATAP